MKYRFKFLQDAQEERAPLEPGKGGVRIVPIATGTERIGTAASVNYWESRGVKIEVLEKIDDKAPPAPSVVGAFGVPLTPGPQPMTKRTLMGVLEIAEKALNAGDLANAAAQLIVLEKAEIEEPLGDLADDHRTVLFAAIEDVQERGELSVNVGELLEAIDFAKDALLPPSRRRHK